VLKRSEQRYQYDFPASYRRFRPDNVKGQMIHFIIAAAPPDTAVRVDGREIDAYAWAEAKDIPRYIHRKVYRDLVSRLYDEAMGLPAFADPRRL